MKYTYNYISEIKTGFSLLLAKLRFCLDVFKGDHLILINCEFKKDNDGTDRGVYTFSRLNVGYKNSLILAYGGIADVLRKIYGHSTMSKADIYFEYGLILYELDHEKDHFEKVKLEKKLKGLDLFF